MKAKLINRGNGDYKLYVDGATYATTSDSPYKKLSKQNCDDIFGVIDVEKLACEEIRIHIDTYQDIHAKSTEKNSSPCTPLNEGGCVGANLYSQVNGFIKGFNKRAELNKDKMFTLDDMKNAMDWMMTQYFEFNEQPTTGRRDEYLKSLQQPTEIEVEIDMESMNLDEIREQGKGFLNANTNKPKLDSNGCLILKREK